MIDDDKEVKLSLDSEEVKTVLLAQDGNMQAFEHIVTLYEGYIYNLAYNMFNNRLDAQDVTQEIFLRIYKDLHTFKNNCKFKTWVYRVAINKCIDEIRKRKGRIFELIEPCENDKGEIISSIHKSVEDELIEQEIRNDLRLIIKDLPVKYRLPIILRDLQGLKYDEIAETLKLNINTVKVRVNRGRIKLKEKYLRLEAKKSKEKREKIVLSLEENEKMKKKEDNKQEEKKKEDKKIESKKENKLALLEIESASYDALEKPKTRVNFFHSDEEFEKGGDK